MFPWQGEGKSAICRTSNNTVDSSSKMQHSPQPPDATYMRWRLSSGSQRVSQAKTNKSNNLTATNGNANASSAERPSSNNGSDNVQAAAAAAATAVESLAGVFNGNKEQAGNSKTLNGASRDDGEEVDDSGDDDDANINEQDDSEGEDIDFKTPAADATNSSINADINTPSMAERQAAGSNNTPSSTPRNPHARRLNAEEEIKLFELCIKNASTFGERSKLCEWWKNIADEFVQNYGGPYSWHSVRRKVDLVTKQRIRYLADLKRGDILHDQATEPWRKVLDEWIPTWEKFENAEKRRIEVRDARAATRKRKEPPMNANSGANSPKNAPAAAAAAAAITPPGFIAWQAAPQRWAPFYPPTPYGPLGPPPPPHHMGPPQAHYPLPPSGLKMPEGYESMFRSPLPGAAGPGTFQGYPPHPHMMPPPTPSSPSPASAIPPMQQTPTQGVQNESSSSQQQTTNTAGAGPSSESSLTTAVLETLVKLNKHLEKASGDTTSSSSPPSTSPIIAALAGKGIKLPQHSSTSSAEPNPDADAEPPSPSPTPNNQPPSSTSITLTPLQLTTLKNDLRQEIQHEFQLQLEKLQASFSSKLDSLEQAQEMILDMLRQEPGREEATS